MSCLGLSSYSSSAGVFRRIALVILWSVLIIDGFCQSRVFAADTNEIISEFDLPANLVKVLGCDPNGGQDTDALIEINEESKGSPFVSRTLIDSAQVGFEEPGILRLSPQSRGFKCRSGKLLMSTKGLVVGGNSLPDELILAQVDPNGSLIFTADQGFSLKKRSYRYTGLQLFARLVITGIIWSNSDHYELVFRPGSEGFIVSAMREFS